MKSRLHDPVRLIIVSPAYNEAKDIGFWIDKVDNFFSNCKEVASVRLIVIDDGSLDNTFEAFKRCSQMVQHIEVIPVRLVKNFGHQAALICGLMESVKFDADVVVTMDADDEHPVELVPNLIASWRSGSIIVHTVRNENSSLPFIKRNLSKAFYSLIRLVTELPIEAGMADFKLWDHALLRECSIYLERCGALRLFAIFVYPSGDRIEFDQKVVAGRISRFSSRKMLSLGVQSVVFYSSAPMRFIGILGGSCILGAFCLSVHTLYAYFVGYVVPGWTTLVLALSFFSGTISLSLYIVAEYLLRLSFRARLPLYIKGS